MGLTEKDRDNLANECNEHSIHARDMDIVDQQIYDVFEVSPENWFVKNKDARWMPLNDLYIGCEDKENPYKLSNTCTDIQVDELQKSFVSTRSWATNFSTFYKKKSDEQKKSIVQVYERPVYKNGNDLILFTGRRWIITTATSLNGTGVNDASLVSFLESEFHGRWSEYTVAFFSEPVTKDTPQDKKTPVGLSWCEATPKIDRTLQSANENVKVPTVLLCSGCDNDTNRCFYDGKCLSNRTCDCTSGSNGTLCQVLPTGNGMCDNYFNEGNYNYDGGDCCINTCVSSDDNKCGRDKSASFYVGYDTCKTKPDLHLGYRKSTSSTFKDVVATCISLSENGRTLALIDSITSSVFVFDNDGSNWITRGSAVTSMSHSGTNLIRISAYDFSMNYKNVYTPITVYLRNVCSRIDVHLCRCLLG